MNDVSYLFFVNLVFVAVLIVLYRRTAKDSFRLGISHLQDAWFDLAARRDSTLSLQSEVYRSVETILVVVKKNPEMFGFGAYFTNALADRKYGESRRPSYTGGIESLVRELGGQTEKDALRIWFGINYVIDNYVQATSWLYRIWRLVQMLGSSSQLPSIDTALSRGVSANP